MDIQWLLQMPQQKTGSVKLPTTELSLQAGDQLTASVLDVSKGSDALLAFDQFKAYARLPLPVVSGQDVTIRVEASGQNLRMVMVPSGDRSTAAPAGERMEVALFEPVSDKALLSIQAKSLKPGETLQGRITGFEKDGLKLVDFGRFKAFAKIDIPVRHGQVVPLTVLQGDSVLSLAVAHERRPPVPTGVPAPAADRTGSTAQPAVVQPTQATPATNSPSPPISTGDVTASPAGMPGLAPPPKAADLAVLREQVQQLVEARVQPMDGESRPLPPQMTNALINLQQGLAPASTNGDMNRLVARIREFVENSGIYFEKRLEQAIQQLQDRSRPMTVADLSVQPAIREIMVKDLKPNLLILKYMLDSQSMDMKPADRHMLEALKSVVQRTVAHIDQQQTMATEKPVDPDLFQAFSHFLFLTENQRNARLKVYYAKKGRNDAHKKPRVSLLLEMDRMGTVRTDLWKAGKDLNVTFFVQHAKIKTAIETDLHLIAVMLDPLFDTVAVRVLVNEEKIAEFDGEDISITNQRQVDLSV